MPQHVPAAIANRKPARCADRVREIGATYLSAEQTPIDKISNVTVGYRCPSVTSAWCFAPWRS